MSLVQSQENPKRIWGFTALLSALSHSQFLTPNLGKWDGSAFVPVVPALSSALSPHPGQKMSSDVSSPAESFNYSKFH